MSIHPNDTDLIERYFENDLSGQEADDLRRRTASDHELKSRFDQERVLVNSIRLEAAKSNLRHLRDLEGTLSGNVSIGRWYYYAAAASVALLVVAWFYMNPMRETRGELFTAYFEAYPNVIEPVVRGTTAPSERAIAFQAYEAHEYEKAITGFNTLLQENREAGIILLQGSAQLALGRTEDATAAFNEVLVTSDVYDHEATWYLSLCHLKAGNEDQARALWHQLASDSAAYGDEARALLEKTQ